jgi:hypothetical protein
MTTMCESEVTEDTVLTNSAYGESAIEAIQERIAKLNKRAIAKGFPQCELSWEFAYVGYQMVDGGYSSNKNLPSSRYTGKVVNVFEVTLRFPKLAIGDWELLGCLRPLQLEDGSWENLVNNVPGKTIPGEFAKVVNKCDHCQHKRHRTETFVVKNRDTEELKSIGRNCIRDFLGHDPSSLLWIYEAIQELSDEDDWGSEYGGGNATHAFELVRILAWSIKCIENDGWVSGSMANLNESLTPTSSRVARILHDAKPFDWSELQWRDWLSDRMYTDADMDTARLAIEWAKGLSGEGWAQNANLIARVGMAGHKELGLACSIAACYLRSVNDAKMAAKEKALEIDEYFGEVGKRYQMEVNVIRIIPCEGQFGTTGLHIMRSKEGHSLKWFSSGEWLKEGETVVVKGTVKEHSEYKGKKQTSLSRVKAVETPEMKAAAKAQREQEEAERIEIANRPKVW